MLGLLLIVTMLANYLATELPGQMAVNEGDHELQVENQLLRLGSLLRGAAASGALGAQLSQPISLGSQGEPPFAPPSGGAIGPGVAGSSMYATFTVSGPTTLTQTTSGAPGASFVLRLENVYSPQAYFAYDEGAIVYAQPNGVPVLLVTPNVTYADAKLSVWMPEFVSTIGTEVGVGVAALSVRLVSLLNISLPDDNYELSGSTTLKVVSPYAQAWWSFFNSTIPSVTATCSSTVKNACDGPFLSSLPLGTVAVTVPATALAIQVATFGVTLS